MVQERPTALVVAVDMVEEVGEAREESRMDQYLNPSIMAVVTMPVVVE